jgi:hypothetical protein
MPDGEIGFQIDDGDFPRTMPDDRIPDSFQHRVSCNSLADPNPWILDSIVDEAVSYTSCKNLVAQSTITLKTNFFDRRPRSIPFRPVPVSQDWQGYKIASTPGESAYQLSTCCDPEKCPNICLVNSQAQRCHLEIFTVGAQYEEDTRSADSLFYNAFMRKFKMKVVGGRLNRRFRIPCEYCPLTNCITNCTNGQYATQYSDYQVNRVGWGVVVPGRLTKRMPDRVGSRRARCSARPASQAHGIRAWTRKPASGKATAPVSPMPSSGCLTGGVNAGTSLQARRTQTSAPSPLCSYPEGQVVARFFAVCSTIARTDPVCARSGGLLSMQRPGGLHRVHETLCWD